MKARHPLPTPPPATSAWLWSVRSLGLLALGLSGYLLMGSLTGNRLPGCGLESGCGAVLGSRWANWFGVPVSLFAVLTYLILLAATFAPTGPKSPVWRQRIGLFLTAAAGAIVGAALWFIVLQAVVIKAFCPFCMAAHACGLLLGFLILTGAFRAKPASTSKRPAAAAASRLAIPSGRALAAGLGASLVLAVGQIIHRPATFLVDAVAGGGIVSADPRAGSRPTPDHPAERIVSLHEGAIALDLYQLPLMGSPNASNVVVHLFDYSCKHCRELHPVLVEVWRNFSNQLAVVSLPMPLATNCNRLIKQVMAQHTNACDYARAGLAVWRARPDRLAAFDDWIFAPSRPPSPEQVRAEARRLVGTNEFNAALQDPWIDAQVELAIRLIEANQRKYRRTQMPQLLIGTNLVSGAVPTVPRLRQLLTNQFDLLWPPTGAAATP